MTGFLRRILAAILAAFVSPAPIPPEEADEEPPVAPATTEGQEPPVPTEGDDDEPREADDNSFLWKPISDGDGKAAVITPANLTLRALSVRYGKREEYARGVGRGNGNRQNWRLKMPGAKYGKRIVVVGLERGGGEHRWVVPNGANRWRK